MSVATTVNAVSVVVYLDQVCALVFALFLGYVVGGHVVQDTQDIGIAQVTSPRRIRKRGDLWLISGSKMW
jgi:hypothetical protein